MDTPPPLRPERESERYTVAIKVDCSTKEMFVSNHVMNISRGGLFIASDQPLPISSEVRLSLELRHPQGIVPRDHWVGDQVPGSLARARRVSRALPRRAVVTAAKRELTRPTPGGTSGHRGRFSSRRRSRHADTRLRILLPYKSLICLLCWLSYNIVLFMVVMTRLRAAQ
jgi:hypothetical protein